MPTSPPAQPVDPRGTLFRPGSVSKLFTWTAVMQLVEQGKLDLDKDVNTYIDFKIPAYDGKPVTLRNIMTHTTGMEEQIRWLIATDPKAVAPLDAALKHWVPERIFAPGGTPAYSNYATALAGYIVQRVSGEPFDAYIKRHIFDPLGHAAFELQPAAAAGPAGADVEGLQHRVRRQAAGLRTDQHGARRQPGRDRCGHGPLHDRPPAERRVQRRAHPRRGHRA